MLGILFYSRNCQYCQNLMAIMESEGIIRLFKLKNIDDMNETELVNLSNMNIQFVPTLMIVNNVNGNQQRVLYAKEQAFMWVNAIANNKRFTMLANAHLENARRLIQLEQVRRKLSEGLQEYCHEETQGVSDSYSYWKDDLTQDIDMPQPKSFMPLGQESLYQIITVQSENNNKLNKYDQEELTKKMEQMRKQQEEQLKVMMEQQQLAYINTNLMNK